MFNLSIKKEVESESTFKIPVESLPFLTSVIAIIRVLVTLVLTILAVAHVHYAPQFEYTVSPVYVCSSMPIITSMVSCYGFISDADVAVLP